MPRVDYDAIAHLYDVAERDYAVDPHLIAFLAGRRDSGPRVLRTLDVSCGTGKQITANRERFPNVVFVGVDRFAGMLAIARRRCPDAFWVQGDGARLPLESNLFQYVSNEFAYPHVRDTPALLAEIFRVLDGGGRFVMTNIDPWAMTDWLIYRTFPEALALDRQDFVPVERFVALMYDSGFENVQVAREHRSVEKSLSEFLAFTQQRHRTSQMMAIDDDAYRAGVQRLEETLAAAPGGNLTVTWELALVTITGDKPQE